MKRDGPKVCTFGPTLTTCILLKMTEIEKDRQWWEKTSAIRLSKYFKIKALPLFFFPGKIQLLFAILTIFARKQSRVTNQRFRIKI